MGRVLGKLTANTDSVRALRDAITLLRESKRQHRECRNPFCTEDCNAAISDDLGLECDCGATAWNARVDAVLKRLGAS